MSSIKVAVDDQLSSVKKNLQERGYTVVSPENASDVAAVVVSGTSSNVANAGVPVIDATGKDEYEIYSAIRETEVQQNSSF